MKRSIGSILAVAALVALAMLLNPSPERHRDQIRQELARRSPVVGMLGLGALKAFASDYHTVGVASYTRSGDRTLSVGALGVVFVLD